ncbi:hypothetical protein ORV05_11120 [Amycolatopsis cynarae]|uniref:DUF7674 domain-containing protein n=1 Tax=Amycolatopsis cynarae TaxID=2995223 RepID=A0ABY7B8K8_9PSEU|nr:hypothetical protein [Amycolatopsis sp. HUAS 11-8]WAL68285.1 hypothetical protein ORV05_11120 [Amycolatopsis sp. HUAS 11-8]
MIISRAPVSAPSWWPDLLRGNEILADRDGRELAAWTALGGPAAEFPLALRLAALARALAAHLSEVDVERRRRLFGILERVLVTGSEYDAAAVATGFFEALLNAWDRGFPLRAVWPQLGPESRAYCLAWNELSGVDSPEWMYEDDPRR